MDRFANIKGLLFDKDGTLIDFSGSWLQPVKDIARLVATRAGNPALEMQLLIDGGYIPEQDCWAQDSTIAFDSSESLFRRWAAKTSPALIESLIPQMQAIVLASLKHAVPAIDNIPMLLTQLSQHYTLGVASMDDEINVSQTLNGLCIADLLAFYCGADSGFGQKPGPGMVKAFCAKTGIPPQQVAVIGDGLHDLEMAHAAGAMAIGVTSGASSEQTLSDFADILIRDIGELKAYLL